MARLGTKKTTEVSIPDGGTTAKVIERKDGKTVTYEATVTETEKPVAINNDDSGFNDDIPFDQIGDDLDLSSDAPLLKRENIPQAPPLGKLEQMFEWLIEAVERDRFPDAFVARVTRQPDPIGSHFRKPCKDVYTVGMFHFTKADMLDFDKELHRLNDNSGGVFNVNIYRADTNAAVMLRRPVEGSYGFQREFVEIRPSLLQYHVKDMEYKRADSPRPAADLFTSAFGVPPNNAQTSQNPLILMMQMQQRQHEEMMRVLTQPKEKSAIEAAIEQKIIRDALNPPTDSGGMQAMQQLMVTMFSMPSVVNKMTEQMFPTPAAPAEKDWIDKINQVADMPVTQKLLERIGDIGEAIAISRLPQANNPSNGNDPDDEPMNDNNELLTTILDELESDSPLDATNETLQELKTEFADQYEDLQLMCKVSPFESVFSVLVNKGIKKMPEAFRPFLDFDATRERGAYVWTDRGNAMQIRLQQLYTFLRESE